MPHIVVGIDGTNSINYVRNWVYLFCAEVKADAVLYLDGPTQAMGVTGWDCTEIYEKAKKFIEFNVGRVQFQKRSDPRDSDLRITLVGHSRGGHTAIALARDLKYPVYFLALYDAVDKTLVLGDTTIVRNVKHTVHARRSPFMSSRDSWGNTGLRSSSGTYKSEFFATNHGGVGGDDGLLEADSSSMNRTNSHRRTGIFDDGSCTNGFVAFLEYKKAIYDANGDPLFLALSGKNGNTKINNSTFPFHGENNIGALCGQQSEAAHKWICHHAKLNGIRFKTL